MSEAAIGLMDLSLGSRADFEWSLHNCQVANSRGVSCRLARLRCQAGLSSSDVVKRLQLVGVDICLATYMHIESGRRRHLSFFEAMSICSLYGVSFSSIFCD